MKRTITVFLGAISALAILGVLFQYSLFLAAMQPYAAEECEIVYTARTLVTGQTSGAAFNTSLYHLPFMWLAREANQAVELFASARIISFLTFWLNLLLLALATGAPLKSWKFLYALLGAATLSLLWDFGFEIRPANLLLTGLLLTWCVVRSDTVKLRAYVIAGALAAMMLFTMVSAWLYVLPLTLVLILLPTKEKRLAKWKLWLAWGGGALAMYVIVRLSFGFFGIWGSWLASLMASSSTGSPAMGKVLGRLLIESPLLVAVSSAGLISIFLDWCRRGGWVLACEEGLPEALMALMGYAALFLYPAGQPGGLLLLAAFAFLFAFRYGSGLLRQFWSETVFRPVIITLLIFAHVVPFVLTTKYRSKELNFRQTQLMQLAEEFTDSTQDYVYDGAGMIPTRSGAYRELRYTVVSDPAGEKLSMRSPAVIIRSRRTAATEVKDHEFFRSHYVPLADDFWVLGQILPAGGGTFQIIHPGRYQITPKELSSVEDTYQVDKFGFAIAPEVKPCVGQLDGQPITNIIVELSIGEHQIHTTPDCEPAIVWLGPKSNTLTPLPNSDHRRLFVNWY